MNKLTVSIRILVSIVMLYFIYFETGVVTTCAMAFILIHCELSALSLRRADQALRDMFELVKLNRNIYN